MILKVLPFNQRKKMVVGDKFHLVEVLVGEILEEEIPEDEILEEEIPEKVILEKEIL